LLANIGDSRLRALDLNFQRGDQRIFCVNDDLSALVAAGKIVIPPPIPLPLPSPGMRQFSVDGQAVTVGIEGPLIVDDGEACVRAALRGVIFPLFEHVYGITDLSSPSREWDAQRGLAGRDHTQQPLCLGARHIGRPRRPALASGQFA
jgi:hypothetical protein